MDGCTAGGGKAKKEIIGEMFNSVVPEGAKGIASNKNGTGMKNMVSSLLGLFSGKRYVGLTLLYCVCCIYFPLGIMFMINVI